MRTSFWKKEMVNAGKLDCTPVLNFKRWPGRSLLKFKSQWQTACAEDDKRRHRTFFVCCVRDCFLCNGLMAGFIPDSYIKAPLVDSHLHSYSKYIETLLFIPFTGNVFPVQILGPRKEHGEKEDQTCQAHTSFKDEIYARRIKNEEIFVLCFLCYAPWQVAHFRLCLMVEEWVCV